MIAIISLLVSILLPSIQKAKDLAKTTVCATQMRSYGTAVQMYLNEFDQIPWYLPSSTSLVDELWCNVLKPFLGLSPTDSDDRIRQCPTGEAWIGAHYGGENPNGRPHAPFVYGKIGTKEGKPVTFLESKDPAGWALVLDSAWRFVYTPSVSDWKLLYDSDNDGLVDSLNSNPIDQYNRAKPRVHNIGCNVTLCDGHVEWVSFEELFATDSSGDVAHPFWWRKK